MNSAERQTVTIRLMAAAREGGFYRNGPLSFKDALAWSPGWPDSATVLEFLDAPTTVGELRAAAISRLEVETGQNFNGDLWRAVEWLKKRRSSGNG